MTYTVRITSVYNVEAGFEDEALRRAEAMPDPDSTEIDIDENE